MIKKGLFLKIKNSDKKTKYAALVAVLILLIAAGFVFRGKIFSGKNNAENGREGEPAVYEALVQIRDQMSGNPEDDARSSLKKGDVLVILPTGHGWSDTERISYLILKLKLSPEDAAKLAAPEQKEKKLSKEEKEVIKKDGEEPRAQMETIRARAYRVKIETLDFNPETLHEKQPFPGKVFDASLIEKKNQ